MTNSITNAMHAAALSIYTYLVYQGLINDKPHYTIWIFLLFLIILILKLIGVLVHIPRIEKDRKRHNFFWVIISVLVIVLNIVTLMSINSGWILFAAGMSVTSVLCVMYVRSLFTGTGSFLWIAAAMAFMHILCASVTHDMLRVSWICLMASSILWIALSRVPFLLRHKFHNDIYHLTLIASTYLLYTTVPTGLWTR